MALPTMHDVNSSNLHSVGHDGAALFVRFRTKGLPGQAYRYAGAPAAHADGIRGAVSPGTYFHQHVKNAYTGEKVD